MTMHTDRRKLIGYDAENSVIKDEIKPKIEILKSIEEMPLILS
jgi:hypothetical protein